MSAPLLHQPDSCSTRLTMCAAACSVTFTNTRLPDWLQTPVYMKYSRRPMSHKALGVAAGLPPDYRQPCTHGPAQFTIDMAWHYFLVTLSATN